MAEYELREFVGFNALSIDCEDCKKACSLDNNECRDCALKQGFDFSLLEIKKKHSLIYYDGHLSKKISSGLFDLVPLIAPKFLLFYALPIDKGTIIEECKSFKIVLLNGEKMIVFMPEEYSLGQKELEAFSSGVLKAQSDDFKSVKVPELDGGILRLIDSYTKGLGILDFALMIPEIQDVFINSPGNSCVFFSHSKYGQLKSNLYFKKEMLNRIGTYLRATSSRSFDESFPAIHAKLEDLNSRICGITYPLSHSGTGFAIRKHQINPVSIQKMAYDGFIDSRIAAILWFFIESDIKILITGPRGSGKTTLLGSLLFLSDKKNRIIAIEDTSELPVPHLRNLGFNVEHLRTNSFDSIDSFEFSNDAALRTALRLGESLLVLGEVRGQEARFLFEAMRVGASGNNVLGTIHGSSAFDTFDRVVNDLGVPASSFKAADLVLCCSYFNSKKAKGRKLFEITEVKKDWVSNPLKENGFEKIASLNPRTGTYSISLKNSALIKSIAFKKGIRFSDCMKSIDEKKQIIDSMIKEYKIIKNDYLLGNELVSKVCSILGSEKPLSHALSEVKKSSFILDSKNSIIDALEFLGAFSKKSCVSSNELFKKSNIASRVKFNGQLNYLEQIGKIKSIAINDERHWHLKK